MGRLARDSVFAYHPITLRAGLRVGTDPEVEVNAASVITIPSTARELSLRASIADLGAFPSPPTAEPYSYRWEVIGLIGGSTAVIQSPKAPSTALRVLEAGDRLQITLTVVTAFETATITFTVVVGP